MNALVGEDGYNKSLMKHVCSPLERCDILKEVASNCFSPFGSSCVEITEVDIAAFREGKVLRHDDGEYTHFLVMKVL